MRERVEQYPCLSYSTFVVPDVTTDNEPCYQAYHPELEGCMSHGRTPEETLRNLGEVTELYITTLLEKGLEVPAPQGVEITWDVVSPATWVEADIYAVPSVRPPTFAPIA